MKSPTTTGFRRQLAALPDPVRRQARKQFGIWLKNPQHPSLHFKPVGSFWSARVNRDIAHAGGGRDIGDDQMFGVKDREYLFGRDVGLAIGVYGGKPAEDAGLGGGLEFGGKHKR